MENSSPPKDRQRRALAVACPFWTPVVPKRDPRRNEMNDYRHHLSGFFAHRPEAETALASLVARGLPEERLHLFDANSGPPVAKPKGESNEVLTNVLVDGAIGTVVGTGIGALAEIALVAANVTLFVASPLIAPLVMLGWGGSVGALLGAAAGANKEVEHKEGWLSDLVRDAIASGQVVLVVDSRNEHETAIAKEVLATAVGEYADQRADQGPGRGRPA